MKKLLFGFAFIAAIGVAFAGNKLMDPSQSYKLSAEPGQPCHTTAVTEIPQCNGGLNICTLPFGTGTITYYADANCVTPLRRD